MARLPNRRSHRRPPRGFTIIELMTVLVVAGIMTTIGFPFLSDALAAQRLRASGTDLMSSLLLARSEAIKRNGQVQVRPKTGADWTSGWAVTSVATGEQFDAKDALGNRVAVDGAPASITYVSNGRLSVPGVTRIAIRDTYARAQSRCLVVDPSGLPTLALGTTSGC